MRILFLNPVGALGGGERSLLEILSALRQVQPKWELGLVVGTAGPLAAKAEALGVQVRLLPMPDSLAGTGDSVISSESNRVAALASALVRAPGALIATAAYVKLLRAEINAFQPDIIHSNGFKMHILGSLSNSGSVPLVWHIRDYVSSRTAMKPFLRLFRKRCSLALGNSRSVTADIALATGLPAKCLYNAVDCEAFQPNGPKADLDVLSGEEAVSGVVRVGLVATFARWKGHEVFFRALAQLPSESKFMGYVIGGPQYRTAGSQFTLPELRELAKTAGVADRVRFTGFLDDRASAMRSLDIVVHASSNAEPFGLVIAEGMALGKAVVLAGAGGARELALDEKEALHFEPGNPASLADKLYRFIQSAELRAALGENARAGALARFNPQRLIAELQQFYAELVPVAQIRSEKVLEEVRS